MSIEILLATYNGAAYLSDQLDSLLEQTIRAFTILARDDCSTDGTVQILADYAARHSGRIRVLPSPPRQVGTSANFAALVDAADAEYIFFSDQDDVWLPDKMAFSLAAMERMIGSHGASSPLLVHTDLIVVDAELRTLGSSLHRYAGFAPERNRLGELLLGNVVTGCTIMANRPLYSLARPISHAVLMYDHWFAQVAAAMGAIAFVDHPTILYRQHHTNVVGVGRAGIPRFLTSLRRTLLSDATLRVLASYSDHAGVLLARFGERVDPLERQQLEALTHIWAVPRMRRYAALRQTGLGKSRFVGDVALSPIAPRPTARCGCAEVSGSAPPLVSVVVPAHNAEATLAQTLLSAMARAYPHLEIVVVDDGSTNGTAGLVSRFYRWGKSGADDHLYSARAWCRA